MSENLIFPEGVPTIPLNSIKKYEHNSRNHDANQISQIVSSIKEFGFTNPILVSEDNTIIAGHGRFEAAKQLGLGEVPYIRLCHLTDEQKRAYVIADNKLALNATWNEDLLKDELIALQTQDFDITLTGFEEEELLDLLNEDDSSYDYSENTGEGKLDHGDSVKPTPTKTSEGYVQFSIVLQEEDRDDFVRTLNSIKSKEEGINTSEEALLFLARLYRG